MIDRIVDASAPEPEAPEELQLETACGRRIFANYIGQERLKRTSSWLLRPPKSGKEALDHVLLYGSPGLGQNDYGQRDCQ